GIGAPKDTPAEVIDKLNTEINAVTADPLIKARLAGLGVDPMSMTSAAFGTFIADEAERGGKGIRTAGIKAEERGAAFRGGTPITFPAGNSSISPRALPRFPPSRGEPGRRPIRRGWCASSLVFQPAARTTSTRA